MSFFKLYFSSTKKCALKKLDDRDSVNSTRYVNLVTSMMNLKQSKLRLNVLSHKYMILLSLHFEHLIELCCKCG